MVDITVFELHIEEGSMSANLPFSGISEDETDEPDEEEAAADDDSSKGKGLALLGVFVFLVLATAAVKYLSGEDEEPDVAIDTADEESPTVPA